MAEWKRIFGNRRICIALLLIFLLNGFLFVREQVENDYGMDCELPAVEWVFSSDGDIELATESADSRAVLTRYLALTDEYKSIAPSEASILLETEKERLTELLDTDNSDETRTEYAAVNNLLAQAEYLSGYESYLLSIQENKERLLSYSVFGDTDSFSGRNILKTAEDFEVLDGSALTIGADGAVTSLLEFALTDYLLLAAVILICIAFLEERKKGLWNTVHAAPDGRLRLALQRTGILFFVSLVGVLLLYGTNLLVGFSIYGGADDLGRAAQSVEVLGKMTIPCTIGQFLAFYLLFRIGATFLVALLLWLMFTAINNVRYTIIITIGVLAVEYSLYTFLPVQSGWNLVKYFNIFTYISLSDLYTNYLNIDLFGYPVGIRMISETACLPLILLLGFVCIVIHCRKRPATGKDLLGRFAYGINRMADCVLCRLPLLGMELHKTLIIQKGVLVFALFCYLASGLSYTVSVPVSTSSEAAARQYTAELEGEITDDTLQQIELIQAELDAVIAAYSEAAVQYENGEIEYSQYDVFVREAEAAQTKSEGLATVRERVEELCALGDEKGFTPWLIDESQYQGTYGEEARSNQQSAAFVALMAITLLLAGSLSYEQQSGMNMLLASTLRGRGQLFRRKIALAVVITIVIWAVVYGRELSAFWGVCRTDTLAAAVQNLSILEEFGIVCSIRALLIGLYLLRLLALFACAMLTMLVSAFMKRMDISYIAACGVMLLPSALYLYMGLEPLRYLSLVPPVEVMPLLTDSKGGGYVIIVVYLLMVILIGICTCTLCRKMKATNQLAHKKMDSDTSTKKSV